MRESRLSIVVSYLVVHINFISGSRVHTVVNPPARRGLVLCRRCK